MLQLMNNQKRKDVNFFAIQKRKNTAAMTGALIALIPIVIVGAMCSVYAYNRHELEQLNEKLNKANRDFASINLEIKQPILDKAIVKRDIFATYFAWVDSLNTQLKNYKIVSSDLIASINNAGAGLVTCTSIAAKDNSLTYAGVGKTMSDIATFQHNCMEIPNVSNAFVQKIEKRNVEKTVNGQKVQTKEVEYVFTMTAAFTNQPSEQ
ncbi:MAG: hypothetical protein N2171_04435 [Clostridia bacterium]|nr:hypothetical protein [Clostridia bacterium]